MKSNKYSIEENGFPIEKAEEKIVVPSRHLDIVDIHIRCGNHLYILKDCQTGTAYGN